MKTLLYFLAALCLAQTAFAGVLDCQPTMALEPVHQAPEKINSTNNLIRKTGSFFSATGEYVMVRGRVVDEDCVGVQNAIVSLWQADAAGKVRESYEDRHNISLGSSFDPYFAYSGRIKTNNQGEFVFVTIIPGTMEEGGPAILNISVAHEEFMPFASQVSFPWANGGAAPKLFLQAPGTYATTLVLEGVSRFMGY